MEMSNLCLFHHCILEVDNLYGFHSFTTGEFCLRMNQTYFKSFDLDDTWLWDLRFRVDDEISRMKLDDDGVFWWWMYFAYKYMNFGGPEGGLLGIGLCIPKIHMMRF